MGNHLRVYSESYLMNTNTNSYFLANLKKFLNHGSHVLVRWVVLFSQKTISFASWEILGVTRIIWYGEGGGLYYLGYPRSDFMPL